MADVDMATDGAVADAFADGDLAGVVVDGAVAPARCGDGDYTSAGAQIDTSGRTLAMVQGLTADDQASAPANTATINAALASAGPYAIVQLPAGRFYVDGTIHVVVDGQILRGAGGVGVPRGLGAQTTLEWLSTSVTDPVVHGISLRGQSYSTAQTTAIGPASKGQAVVTVLGAVPAGVTHGVIVDPKGNADGLGQVVEIVSATAAAGQTTLVLSEPLWGAYAAPQQIGFFGKILRDAGVENLVLDVEEGSSRVQEMVHFEATVNCWQRNCESRDVQRFHTFLKTSYHCTVSGNLYNDASNHHDGGQGYGINLGNQTTSCLFEGNDAVHLRHSYVVQGGSHGNVLAHNRSRAPRHTNFANGGPGDISFHGPSANNLAEGNVVQRIHIGDASTVGPQVIFRNVLTSGPLTVANTDAAQLLTGNIICGEDASLQSMTMPAIGPEDSNQGFFAGVAARPYASGPMFALGTSGVLLVGSPPAPDTYGNWWNGSWQDAGIGVVPSSCYGSSHSAALETACQMAKN